MCCEMAPGRCGKKIDDVFGHTLSNSDKRSLVATLIYYPREKMEIVRKTEEDMENWYKITLYRLIEVCKTTASKYTRSKVRKSSSRGLRLCDRGADHRKKQRSWTKRLITILL